MIESKEFWLAREKGEQIGVNLVLGKRKPKVEGYFGGEEFFGAVYINFETFEALGIKIKPGEVKRFKLVEVR